MKNVNIIHLAFDIEKFNFKQNIDFEKENFGLFFLGQHYKLLDFLFPLFYLVKYFKSKKRRKTLIKIYQNELQYIVFFEPSINSFLKDFKMGYQIFKKIKTKKDVLKINYNDLYIGDLIYDTYIRMYNSPEIKIDINLLLLIIRSLSEINFLEKLNLAPVTYSTLFTTYTASGIPFRFYQKNSSAKMVSYRSNNKGKIHRNDDNLQVKDFKRFKSNFLKLSNKKQKINAGIDYLNRICNGELKYSFMRETSYGDIDHNFNEKLDGVVFLHDFFDSQYIYGKMLFPDFYTWVVETIQFVQSNKLNIGFKPHPNQIYESKLLVRKLKNNFTDVIWIDENTSNNAIFNSGIKFGISVYGSILHELAFNDIIAISCGDSLSDNYNFICKPTDINHYKDLILNFHKIKLNRNRFSEIGEFIYMNYLND